MTEKTDKAEFKVSLEELLEAGAHFGHIVRRWNPKMGRFIWTSRDGVHIFDLVKTQQQLEEACTFVYEQARAGKRIVFVGTKRQAQDLVKAAALEAGIPYITERWLGGTLTNWQQIKARIEHLKSLKAKKAADGFEGYTKKEKVLFDREIDKLERFFGGIADLDGRPDVLFVVDTHKERVTMREALTQKVTVVGVCDSNANPDAVEYPIPANDDAVRSIALIVDKIKEAVMAGKKARA
jgi:small subunit ribosomal protein S2